MNAEPLLYHDTAANAWFSVLINDRQQSYRLPDLPIVLESLPGDANVYLSQGEFLRRSRRLADLSSLALCFADLDTHKTVYGDRTPEHQAQALCGYCEEEGLPRPSLINSSGRGLHCKWMLDPVPAQALPRWNATQKEIGAKLKAFGADGAARDGSRCLRAVGTVNQRNGERCRTVWQDERSGGISRWDFDVFCNEVLPLTREQCAILKQKRQAKQKVRSEAREYPNLWTPQQLWWNRLRDTRRLIEIRGWQGGVPEGYRNNFLFVGACALAWGAEAVRLREEIEGLAKEFVPSLSTAEVRALTSSILRQVQGGNPYRITSERIIELLDIQPDEQEMLQTLVSNDLRAARKREYDRQRHRKGEDDRATYERKAAERKETARTLRAQGMSYRAIAEQMGMTTKQVDYLLNIGKAIAPEKFLNSSPCI